MLTTSEGGRGVRLWGLGVAMVCAWVGARACGGGEFTTKSEATAGTAGTVAVKECSGPEDCRDDDPCTIDECGAEGVCLDAPKCGADKCCGGLCGECCSDSDCKYGLA
jgi:hypothetical protein